MKPVQFRSHWLLSLLASLLASSLAGTIATIATTPALAAPDMVQTLQTAELKTVRAELASQKSAELWGISSLKVTPRLKISRQGKVLFDRDLVIPGVTFRGGEEIKLVDLDRTGEPVVLVDLNTETGSYYQAYRYNSRQNAYVASRMNVDMDLGTIAPVQITQTAIAGTLIAQLSYQHKEGKFTSPFLKITEAGTVMLDKPAVTWKEALTGVSGPRLVDLTGDRRPEIIIDFGTTGAHCCTFSRIYEYDPTDKHQYNSVTRMWGNYGMAPDITDLNNDGRMELVTFDDRFAYAFGAYAGTVRPPQVWNYNQGQFTDVTRQFPKLVRQRLTELEKNLRDRPGSGQVLAAYLASKALVQEETDGWKRVRQVYNPSTEEGLATDAYFTKLTNFLQAAGYSQHSASQSRLELPASLKGSEIDALTFAPDGDTVIVARSNESTIAWIDRTSGRVRRTIQRPKDIDILRLVLSPNGKRLVAQSSEQIWLWELDKGQAPRAIAKPMPGELGDLRFDESNRLLAIELPNGDRPLGIWDLEMGKRQEPLPEIQGSHISFDPVRRILVAADYGSAKITVWDLIKRQVAKEFTANGELYGLRLSENGRTLASWSNAYSVQVWDLAAEAPKQPLLMTIPSLGSAVAIDPTGSQMISREWEALTLWRIRGN